MDALNNILNRSSHRDLVSPVPSPQEMRKVFEAALRAPDHARLKPSRFIEVKENGLKKLSGIFTTFAREVLSIDDLKIMKKYSDAPFRAPMIVVIISKHKEHPKVPELEQQLSTAAAAQNILLSLNALGYGAIWRTGKFALDKRINQYMGLKNDELILGYLYIGTADGKKREVPIVDPSEYLQQWS